MRAISGTLSRKCAINAQFQTALSVQVSLDAKNVKMALFQERIMRDVKEKSLIRLAAFFLLNNLKGYFGIKIIGNAEIVNHITITMRKTTDVNFAQPLLSIVLNAQMPKLATNAQETLYSEMEIVKFLIY